MKKCFCKIATLVGLLVPCVALLMGPSLRAATFSDDNWTSMGGFPGAEGWVGSSAVDASGNLYIGGGFRIAGNVTVNGIAKWDGTNWSALGSGQSVYAMTASGHDVFVAGWFTAATGGVGNSIARWNGTNWSALGSGILGSSGDPYVPALAASGSDLYVGGSFVTAGGNPATNIARWNGTNWSALGSGMDNSVWALAVAGSYVYAGGDFTNAGGVAASRIAKWNGSSWSALGSGMNGTVTKLAARGTDLFVAGQFTLAGGVAATNIAKWDGSSWLAVPSPIYSGNEPILWGSVNALVTSGDDLYAGGDILIDLGGGWISTFSTYVAKWNGSSWSVLEPGVGGDWDPYGEPHVNTLAVSGTTVFAGGEFTFAGNSTAHCIAKWNGTDWSALAPKFCSLSAMTASGRDLYGAGLFPAPGGTPSNYVAKWNGSGWSPLGSGVGGVNALAVSGGDLYAGGGFTNVGDTPVNRIAKWNGISWSALGSGVNGSVSELAASETNLYAAGSFSTAGGIAANGIARWNGSSWSALGSGIGGVWALAASGDDLYAGGTFTSAGGIPANYIAKWNGSTWLALGSGMGGSGSAPGFVTALAVMGNDLYAGGWFSSAGGVGAQCVAKWDGTNWSGLGGLEADYWGGGEHHRTPYVYALAVSGGSLYAGGYFNYAGDENPNFIARWNGNKWSALGSGMDYGVGSLAATDIELFATGSFERAGGKLSPYLARARIGPAAQAVTHSNSAASIRFSGVTGYPHDVQRATNLTPPVAWTTVNSTSLYPAADGSFTFTDTNAAHGAAFYRASAIGLGPAACPQIGLQQPAGFPLTNTVSFGAVALDSSVTKTFTITNSGAGALIIRDVSTWYSDPEFVVNATGMLTNVPGGGSTTFTVTFRPTSTGNYWNEVDVLTDTTECYDPSEGWSYFQVSGTGL